jgi:hypothetical protein
VEAVLFTKHFAGCYFPQGFSTFVFISLDNKDLLLHEGGEIEGYKG